MSYVTIDEAVAHRHVSKRRPLRQYRIYVIEQNRLWCNTAQLHLMQHPGGSHAALSGIEHHNLTDVTLSGQFVLRARKYPGNTVKIVACRKIIVGNKSFATDHRSDPEVTPEFYRLHHKTSPATAEATQFCILERVGW